MARREAAAMPALRQAWLKELGVETLWLGAPAPARVLPAVHQRAADAPGAPEGAVAPAADAAGHEAPAVAAVAEAAPAALAEADTGQEAAPVAADADPVDAPLAEPTGSTEPAALACVVAAPGRELQSEFEAEPESDPEAGPASAAAPARARAAARLVRVACAGRDGSAAPWLVLIDAIEVAHPRAAQRGFLRNLLAAVELVPQAGQVDDAAGTEDWRAALVAGRAGHRLLVVGEAARRALVPDALAGEVALVRVAGVQVVVGVLPALTDVSADPGGKAVAWRVLRGLAGMPLAAA